MLASIYLSYNNQSEVIELPVLPETLKVKQDGNNDTYTLQNIGKITVINPRDPSEISISSFFPANDAPYVSSKILYTPQEYVETIQEWRDTEKPIRITVSGTAVPFTMAVSIENFTYQETSGSVGDVGYTLELKEYRFHYAKSASIDDTDESSDTTTVSITEERTSEKETDETYVVKSGDTLYAIAKAQYGDGSLYTELAENNDISNPNLISVGQVLTL